MRVAFCGKMASGKTTLVNDLMNKYSFTKKYSFAQAVKDFARFVYDIPEDYKDRVKFQKIGDGAREYISPDVWIDAVVNQAKKAPINEKQFLDDARYENEVIRLKKEGWLVVLIDVDDELQIDRLKRTYPNDWEVHVDARNHPSEKGIDSIDKNLFDLVVEARDGIENFEMLDQYLLNEAILKVL